MLIFLKISQKTLKFNAQSSDIYFVMTRNGWTEMTTTNFFSNQDPDLPNLQSLKLPKIKKGLPKIQMTKDSDLLFEIDGKNILMEDVAEKFSDLYFNS